MRSDAKSDLLILDSCGLALFTAEQRRDMLELDDCYSRRLSIVISQLLVDNWQKLIAVAAQINAVLDRLVRNAYWINLKAESMRRSGIELTTPGPSD